MSDIALVHFSVDKWTGRKLMPLGCLHLLATLRRAGFEVELRDVQFVQAIADDTDRLAEFMEVDAPVLGVSVMADRLPLALLTLQKVRAARPDQILIMGGPGPSEVAPELLAAFPFVDAIAVGEGEDTIVDVMNGVRERGREGLAGIPGLWSRQGAEVVAPPARPRIRRLDDSAYPQWCDVDLAPYDVVSLVTARGCPHTCSFCSAPALWGPGSYRRTIPAVIDELRWLVERRPGVRVHIEDDTFTLSYRRVEAFCGAVLEAKLDIEWGGTARVGDVNPPLLQRMVDAGCGFLFMGIDAGDDALLDRLDKGATVAESIAAVELTAQYVELCAHAVWGYPFETLDQFYDTHLLMTYFKTFVYRVGMSHYVPFPKSPLVRDWSGALRPPRAFPFPRIVGLSADPAEGRVVRAHPEVFTPFFWFDTPEWETKFAFAAEYTRLTQPT